MLFLMLKVSVLLPKSGETRVYPQVANDLLTFQVLSFPMSVSKNEKVLPWWSFNICFQVLGKNTSGSYSENIWSLQDMKLFLVLGWKQLVHCHCQLRCLPKQNLGRDVCKVLPCQAWRQNVLRCTSVFFWNEGISFQEKCGETLTIFNGEFLNYKYLLML